ncbi:MAG: hypothetical protein H8E82_02220 [Candidatus Marinimicrobia bacterium]|nr:hypothetical protein [Candidatus Neomarinimicrobiota bacterium]
MAYTINDPAIDRISDGYDWLIHTSKKGTLKYKLNSFTNSTFHNDYSKVRPFIVLMSIFAEVGNFRKV